MTDKKKILAKLFFSTLYLSAFTFGGGYVIVTLMKQKFVDELHWIQEDEMLDAEDSKLILKKGAKCLAPVVILYGIYVVLNGHLSPGGGFSGGSIIGAGLILYSVAFGHKKMQTFFTIKTLTLTTAACLLTYCGCKSYSFFTGANHVGWEVPKGTPGAILSSGFILPLNICVGLVVACTMYGFYALFTKGEV